MACTYVPRLSEKYRAGLLVSNQQRSHLEQVAVYQNHWDSFGLLLSNQNGVRMVPSAEEIVVMTPWHRSHNGLWQNTQINVISTKPFPLEWNQPCISSGHLPDGKKWAKNGQKIYLYYAKASLWRRINWWVQCTRKLYSMNQFAKQTVGARKKFPFSKQDSTNTNIGRLVRCSNIRGLSEWLDETWIPRNIDDDKPVPPLKSTLRLWISILCSIWTISSFSYALLIEVSEQKI